MDAHILESSAAGAGKQHQIELLSASVPPSPPRPRPSSGVNRDKLADASGRRKGEACGAASDPSLRSEPHLGAQ